MILTYDLEKRGRHPIYEYLYLCIREDILSGVIRGGEKLPSKREMARDHKVALITVENAYAQLVIEGYVTAREKSGYFVNPGMAETVRPEKNRAAWAEGGSGLTAAGMQAKERTGQAAGMQAKERTGQAAGAQAKEQAGLAAGQSAQTRAVQGAWAAGLEGTAGTPKKKWLVDFSSGELKRDAFPFDTWSKLMRRVMNDREEAFLTKPDRSGVPELREAIAAYLKKAKGLAVSPGQVLVGPGTEYLHHLILQLVGRSRMVAVEDPGYVKVGQIYEGNGLKVLHVPVDRGGMVVSRLWGTNASLVHTSPSHHFPTGCVMPIGRRRELLNWAHAQEAYVIEDDYDSEFRFDGRPIPTLASLDGERVIYLNTFTKTLAPSIRIAYAVLPEKLKERYDEKLSFYSGAVSSFEQYTLAAFIGEGYYERHVNRMRNYYRQQRTRILETLAASPLADKVSVEEHSAGLHFILRVKELGDEEAWVKELEEHGIRLVPVSAYCYGGKERYGKRFLVYYSDLEPENLKKAFEIMSLTLDRNPKGE